MAENMTQVLHHGEIPVPLYAVKIPGTFDVNDEYVTPKWIKTGPRRLEIECRHLAQHLATIHGGDIIVVHPMMTARL